MHAAFELTYQLLTVLPMCGLAGPHNANNTAAAILACSHRMVSSSFRVLWPDVGRLSRSTYRNLPLAQVPADPGRLGFFSTVGPPAFDAALSANIFDVYGHNRVKSLRAVEQLIEETFAYPFDKLATYRAAYALATITMFGSTEQDGHFHWCVEVLRRPEVIGALTRAPRPSTSVTPGLRLRPTVR
jgi:hypothetical protein